MRDLVTFTAPVVFHDGITPTVGVYGIEGSKPGAAAAAAYLSHRVIRPDSSGYGKILGKCLFNSKRFYAELVSFVKPEDIFTVTPFQALPIESEGGDKLAVKAQIDFIREHIASKSNAEILADEEALKLFRQLGSDLLIVAYSFNFKHLDGSLNRDQEKLKLFNDLLFDKLSKQRYEGGKIPTMPMIVTASKFTPSIYGQDLLDDYGRRLGIHVESDKEIPFLISTVMNPWVTDTEEGNFLPRIFADARRVIQETVNQMQVYEDTSICA